MTLPIYDYICENRDTSQTFLGGRYLSWTGLTTKVFNVGEYRREATQDYRLSQDNILLLSVKNCRVLTC